MEQIKGYENKYEIHLNKNDGTCQPGVWSCMRKQYLNPCPARNYLQVPLWKNNKLKQHKIHRLVAEHFINNPENLATVDHINKDTKDNRIQNLRWFSHSFQNINRTNQNGYCFKKSRNKFEVNIKRDGINYYGGQFEKEEDAKAKAMELRKEIYHDYPDINIWD